MNIILGKTYGALTPYKRFGKKEELYHCHCECGDEVVRLAELLHANTPCECYTNNTAKTSSNYYKTCYKEQDIDLKTYYKQLQQKG